MSGHILFSVDSRTPLARIRKSPRFRPEISKSQGTRRTPQRRKSEKSISQVCLPATTLGNHNSSCMYIYTIPTLQNQGSVSSNDRRASQQRFRRPSQSRSPMTRVKALMQASREKNKAEENKISKKWVTWFENGKILPGLQFTLLLVNWLFFLKRK